VSDRALSILSLSLGVAGLGIQLVFPDARFVGWLCIAVGGAGFVYSLVHDRLGRRTNSKADGNAPTASATPTDVFNGLDDHAAKVWLVPEDGGRRWNVGFRNNSGVVASNVSMRLTDLLRMRPQSGTYVQTAEFYPGFPDFPLLELNPRAQLFPGDSTRFRLLASFGRRVTIFSRNMERLISAEHYGTWKAVLRLEWRLGSSLEYRTLALFFHIDDRAAVSAPTTRPTA